ncbi:MAG: PP2C family protein-serine/threonine phosphatase [Thermomicrobia bacterium]|nr:PP2C family protein-serine/threonine phosphatase [Thermomicrobia bacterium]
MTPVNAPVAEEISPDVLRVEAWIGTHADLWRQMNEAWHGVTGAALRVEDASATVSALAVPVLGGGYTFAMLDSGAGGEGYAPLLEAIAGFIGNALATETELDTMTDELVDSYDQLTFLYEIARMLSMTSTLAEALAALLAQARHIIGADGGAVVIEQAEKPMIVLTDGMVPGHDFITAAHRVVTAANRPLVANDGAAVGATVSAQLDAVTSIIVAPIVTPQGIASAACFGATKPGGFTAGNRKLMQAVAEQTIAIAGQFALQEEQIRRSRLARDLELAAQIQAALLPGPFPARPQVSLVATMVPASEVGGDFYTHPDDRAEQSDVLAFAIGDVAGKGVAAALITTVCLSAMRAEMRHVASPAQALHAVQGFIQDELSRIDSFVTCILATYDPPTRRLEYANAGHNAIFRWRARDRQVEAFGATGLPLGVDVGIAVENATVMLDPGDLLLLYTDGVTEAMSATGELFGDARLCMLLAECADQEPAQIRDTILANIRAFAPVQRDDITLLIVKAEA